MLPLIRPDVTFGEVADDLRSILESGILTSGTYVSTLEEMVAIIVGTEYAVATTSATTALHLSLAAAGIGPGDEVVISDFTFPATANVVVQLGAVPVFVDCAPGSFRVDVAEVDAAITSRTRAIIAVDPFGQPAALPELAALAECHGLFLLEDAACALGASLGGRSCGSWPGAGCFSFHPRKVVTTGEGGMITTDDEALAARARRLRNHGGEMRSVGMVFTESGFNYRLSEIAAALGLSQLRRLDRIVDDRRATAARYDERLQQVDGIQLHYEPPGERWSRQSYVVLLEDGIDRDAVVHALRAHSIETTLGTYAVHAQPAFAVYGYSPGDLPCSYRAQEQSLTLPLLPHMPFHMIERVIDALSEVIS